ncbi:MAG TPA: histidine phosphatase family protein [Gemmatirosa sp.]|nr:histidine phosphatase family protein [Gemmatirosa sp.]
MRLLLIRHAHTAAVGRTLAGRAPGLGLSTEGRREAAALARWLAAAPLQAVYASPMARALETATALARPHGLGVLPAPGLLEVDYGAWTGRDLTTFDVDPAWVAWNAARSVARAPDGETFAAMQGRAVAEALALAARHGDDDTLVAAVTHADVVRAVLGYVLGVPAELQLRLEIAPASITEVELAAWGARVHRVNERAASTFA